MKKLLLLLIVVAAVFVVYNRERLFLRGPLGSVARNGSKESGAQVFINYNSDVLIENDAPLYVEVVEHGNNTGVPPHMQCIHYVACLLDADVPTLAPWPGGITVQSLTSRYVTFRDGKRQTTVTLY